MPFVPDPTGGDSVEQFGSLAPQFTDQFRVLGLTRRGQGRSEKPMETTANWFSVVGFSPTMGRTRSTSEDSRSRGQDDRAFEEPYWSEV